MRLRDHHPAQPLEVQMKAAQRPHGFTPGNQVSRPAGDQPSAVPGGGLPPGAPMAYSQPSQQTHVSNGNGLQSPAHDLEAAESGGSSSGGPGRPWQQQPVPGTVLDTAGGDEEVVASPAEAAKKSADPAAMRQEDRRRAFYPQSQAAKPPEHAEVRRLFHTPLEEIVDAIRFGRQRLCAM